jgi:hypothetical protein
MERSDDSAFIHRSAPTAGIAFGVLILLGIGTPAVFLVPTVGSFVGAAVCALLAFGLVLLWRVRVECSRSADGQSLRFVCRRWPLTPTEGVLPLHAIVRVDVRFARGAQSVVLAMKGGEEITLPGGASSSSSHERTAERLRAWVAAGARTEGG